MDPKKEEQLLNFWKKKKIYEKVRKKNGRKFYFLDGPPYATGSIHMGTAWNKILKDAYIRYLRMRGFHVWDQPGYDTHGLPIENKIEKQFEIKSKADIERLGIEKFIQACREFATKYIGVMNGQFGNLGVWMDWAHPYVTLDNSYIEGAWHTFKVAYDKGFLYRGLYPVHVCPHCETAVAYNEIEYTKLADPSIYVKFKVKGKDEFLVIWTTTPWTLPANTGVMAKPDADYVKMRVSGQTFIIAKDLLEPLMGKMGVADYQVIETMKGKELEGLHYEYPFADIFEFQRNLKNAHRIVLSDQYVTLDTGTGLVHTAPGHGAEDYKVGIENKLPVLSPVNMNGTFNGECGDLAGIFVKAADRIIIDKLKERGLLLHEEKITHDYPLCWRCSSALLQIAVNQWFFKVTKIRKTLLKENSKVRWAPGWAGKRFENWLQNLGDWPISRQRYWGIPLPIWVCEACNAVRVIGSRGELKQKIADLHRPFIDRVALKCRCGGKMKRIPDVLDVWFDSGLASWASLGYPRNKKLFRKLWPADLNIEGPDQIRGWWNSQLITSVITFNRAPFKNIVFHGFILDAHGVKMSKSVGNVIAPEEVVQKYGRDVLRFYFLNSPAWDDFYFKWTDVDVVAKSFSVMENTFNYIHTYVAKSKKPALRSEDKWLLSKLNSLVADVTADYDSYNIHRAATSLQDFIINDLSRWYIKLVRERVLSKDRAAHYTLAEALKTVTKLMAPMAPFIAEYGHGIAKSLGGKNESVFQCDWPRPRKTMVSKKLEAEMLFVQEISEVVNSARKENGLKLRWPIEKVIVETKNKTAKAAVKTFAAALKTIANSKSIELGGEENGFAAKEFSKGKIYVSKAVLKDEALLRELLRAVQDERRKRKLVMKNRIILSIDNETLKKFSKEIKEKVGARELRFETINDGTEVKLDETTVRFRFKVLQGKK